MDRTGVDIIRFMTSNKSMIEAPAGHGKTHSIVDCLEQFEYKGKKILILTHTHAGIASIKAKISERAILPQCYELNTICSFTLNLALAYIDNNLLSDESDLSSKYQEAQEYAIKLLKAQPIKSVLRAKYEHIIVDEYQDCDNLQHKLITLLGDIIKVHILGDAMQSIFGFNGTPVDLNSLEFDIYKENLQTLSTPWRWNNAGCPELGEEILQIRELMRDKQDIDLRQYKHLKFIQTNRNDLYWHRKSKTDIPPKIIQILYKYLDNKYQENVLIIHPISHNKDARIKLTKNLFNLGMLESIDDSDYYDTVSTFENKSGQELFTAIIHFLKQTCAASSLDDYTNSDGSFKERIRKPEKLLILQKLKNVANLLQTQKSYALISSCIKQVRNIIKINVARKDIYYTIERVLMDADQRNISLIESLKLNRDKVRRIGRNIQGKYIGTTLLTKGLECDTVIVLDANKFPDEKHLYVALSRCSKNLYVVSETPILSPYKSRQKAETSPDAIQLSLFSEFDF